MKRVVIQTVSGLILFLGFPLAATAVRADDSAQLKEQVQALENRVGQLESELANKQQVSAANVVPAYDVYEDPFAQMMRVQAQMERNMRQAFSDTGAVFNPRMDIRQTDDKYIMTMDIPGMDKDKINVEFKEGMLIVSGERRVENDDNKNNQYYRQERSFGSFTQAIPLPEDARTDRIDAVYKNGVLKVTVPRMKKEEKKPDDQRIVVK